MTTEKSAHPTSPAKQPHMPPHRENSTDATRGEPLAMRAQHRKAELEALLAKTPTDEKRARGDLELALSSVGELLTGDLEHLSDSTAAALNHWLEGSKHLAEVTPKTKVRSPAGH